MGLLIKDIISQRYQPWSQHDWEYVINTKDKNSVPPLTAAPIAASEESQNTVFPQPDESIFLHGTHNQGLMLP